MRINPITAEQANEQSVGDPWPPGEYDFVIQNAEEGLSQASGSEQIKLTLRVFNRAGQERTVFDYLPSSAKAQWKVRHFAEAVGLVRQYETGEMQPHEMLTRPGRCKLRVKPADGQYSAQNAVADYVPAKASAVDVQTRRAATSTQNRQAAMAGGGGGDLDDEIPF